MAKRIVTIPMETIVKWYLAEKEEGSKRKAHVERVKLATNGGYLTLDLQFEESGAP